MQKPYVQINWKPLAAPLEEMEEIICSSLISLGFSRFNDADSPKCIHAIKIEPEYWVRGLNREHAVELQWKEDPDPPSEFAQLCSTNLFLNPLLVQVKYQCVQLHHQDSIKKRLEQVWNTLKERALDASRALASKKPLSDHGSARWATLSDLKAEDYIQEGTTEDISSRWILGYLPDKLITVPKRLTEAHAIVMGPPGAGKSRTIIVPQLIERLGTSAIVTEVTAGEDLTPTVFSITAGYRAKQGQKVYYLNPSDVEHSTRFNPIDFIQTIDDAIYYADLIITNTTLGTHIGDQIWTQSENHLLTALLLYAWGLGNKTKSVEGGKSNLGYIRSLLRLGPEALNKRIDTDGIAEAKAQFNEFLRNSSPNFRLGVFSGLIQRLNPWLNPKIKALTEVTDFEPEDLRSNLFTFYLAYPIHRRDYRPIMSLALNFLLRLPLRTKFEHPVTFILDEFAAYGRVPGIDDLQATIRNRQIGILLGFQDIQQLAKVYSHHEAEVLFTNCDTKIIFATASSKTQSQISQSLGQTTKIKKSISGQGHIHRQTYGAPLLSLAEIGKIPDRYVLVLRNKRNPVLMMTCEPGKYESYATAYPLTKLPPRKIRESRQSKTEERERGAPTHADPYQYAYATRDPYGTIDSVCDHSSNTLGIDKRAVQTSDAVNDPLEKFIDQPCLNGLPNMCRRSIVEAVTLFTLCKSKKLSFSPVFVSLLRPLDAGSRTLLKNTLCPLVPTDAASQDTFFDFPAAHRTFQAIAQNLRKTLVNNNGASPIGLLKFCLTFQNKEQLGGVFQTIPVAFKKHRRTELPRDLEMINEFRNTYIAHPDVELTDLKLTQQNLKHWIDVIVRLY